MRVCVLGAGVVGLTTAWALTEAGCEVIIVDAANAVGTGASAGNGAQLSYNFVAPFAAPETLWHLPALMLDKAAPVRIKPRMNPGFLRWNLEFLRACTGRMVRETTAAQLALAALSRAELDRLTAATALRFSRQANGKLVVYRDKTSFQTARKQAEAQKGMGTAQSVLDGPECLREEPGLRIPAALLQGGVFTPREEVGDCAAFCEGLAGKLRERNTVIWRMGAPATPVLRDGRLVAVQAGGEEISADQFVLCLGSGAAPFARACGFRLPVEPMKGYSLTLRPRNEAGRLVHSVTDADRKVVFAPLERESGQVIRVAGIADLVGEDRRIDEKRMAMVRQGAADALDVDLDSDPVGWAGLRPCTPDSRPLIGASPVSGLCLNTGHGALGWTLACGSARLAVDMLLERAPVLDAAPFSPGRYIRG